MANIQEHLDLIKNAIYGKDVRQAIHDGIQQCYYDGKAGSTDLEARQRLDTDEANITSLTSRMSVAENDINVLDARVDQIVNPLQIAVSGGHKLNVAGNSARTYTWSKSDLGVPANGKIKDVIYNMENTDALVSGFWVSFSVTEDSVKNKDVQQPEHWCRL